MLRSQIESNVKKIKRIYISKSKMCNLRPSFAMFLLNPSAAKDPFLTNLVVGLSKQCIGVPKPLCQKAKCYLVFEGEC